MKSGIGILIGALGLGILFVFAVLLIQIARPPAPPLRYDAPEYVPESGNVAPFGSLVYTPTLQVAQTGRVSILRSYWNIDTNNSAQLCDGSDAPIIQSTRNLPQTLAGQARANPIRVPLPNLPPGHYWLITSATTPTGGQATYTVSFTITQAC